MKWAKGEDVVGEDSGEDSEDSGEVKCVFTLSFRREDIDGGKNISVRVKSDGTVEGATEEEIRIALQFLQTAYQNQL